MKEHRISYNCLEMLCKDAHALAEEVVASRRQSYAGIASDTLCSFDRKFLEFPIKQKLRDGSHLAERKIMLRIPTPFHVVKSGAVYLFHPFYVGAQIDWCEKYHFSHFSGAKECFALFFIDNSCAKNRQCMFSEWVFDMIFLSKYGDENNLLIGVSQEKNED